MTPSRIKARSVSDGAVFIYAGRCLSGSFLREKQPFFAEVK
jgi:hypothetical protein